MKMINL